MKASDLLDVDVMKELMQHCKITTNSDGKKSAKFAGVVDYDTACELWDLFGNVDDLSSDGHGPMWKVRGCADENVDMTLNLENVILVDSKINFSMCWLG